MIILDLSVIKVVAEAGAVGIALFAVYLNYRQTANHEKHFLDAITKNSEALQKLCDCIENLEKKVIK